MEKVPFISIIIPCRNEEKYIGKCLDSIMFNVYPRNKMEVLVIDGKSDDTTKDIISKYMKKYSFIQILDNPDYNVPTALNIGIRTAKGDIIVRLDAHNVYSKNYLEKCVKYLQVYKINNVGGRWITLPGNNTKVAKSIALALSHPFGVGNAYFRIDGLKNPKFVDTVPFGCYRRDLFNKIGFFNEHLVRNQDLEFNLRLKSAGGKILLAPDIVSFYYARSNFKDLFKQNFLNGYWIINSLKYAKLPFSIRHLIPFIFITSLLISFSIFIAYSPLFYFFVIILLSYCFVNIFFSYKLCHRKSLKILPFISITFSILHFSYGYGSIYGIIKLIIYKLEELCLKTLKDISSILKRVEQNLKY